MSKGCTFYFVRHGETYLNLYRRMQGWSNIQLTEKGRDDVRRSGKGLADVKFDAVYTSDLNRTIETAGIILEENKEADDLTIHAMPELREVFFGSFEALGVDEVWASINEVMGYPTVGDLWSRATVPERMNATKKADPYHHAENYLEFWTRIEKGLIELIKTHRDTGDTVLVVAHGNTIRYMLSGLVPELIDPQPLLNASVSKVSYYDGLYHLKSYNQIDHFKSLEKD
ncbi:histidine phosphatase family protein [Carnobacterium funditum]|uniref:histidine phosphatase family protein n=1 Tax=Carnobacterium funditum TaxID=2752 RepID=UPI000555CA5D|nr:histidine phosphatase family protein [Carnobacterium funditum]